MVRPISTGSGLLAGDSRLIVSRFAPRAAHGASATVGSSQAADPNARAFARLEELLGVIRDAASGAVAGGGANASALDQASIDQTLAEISNLLGVPLQLGGADHAQLNGFNAAQISEYKVLKLRPNANVRF